MRRLNFLLPLIIFFCASARANQSAQGWCEAGAQVVVTSGLSSSNQVMGSFPQCLVQVLIHGGGPATIFTDNNNTVLANPFTANTVGQWQFYAANGHYDVVLSGAGFPSPVTISDILLNDPAAPNTLVSPTITNPTITGTVTGGATYVLPLFTSPTSSGTDIGIETLNNKTLVSPIITGTVAGGATYTGPTLSAPTITGTVGGNFNATGNNTFVQLNGCLAVESSTYATSIAGVQAAINAATGGCVFIPPGTYSGTGPLTITKANIEIDCAGPASQLNGWTPTGPPFFTLPTIPTLLQFTNNGVGIQIGDGTNEYGGIVIKNCGVSMTNAGTAFTGIDIKKYANQVRLENVIVSGNTQHGICMQEDDQASFLDFVTYYHTWAVQCATGLLLSGGNSVTRIQGGGFANNNIGAVVGNATASNHSISGTDFTGVDFEYNVTSQLDINNGWNTIVEGNHFDCSRSSGDFCLRIRSSTNAAGGVVNLDVRDNVFQGGAVTNYGLYLDGTVNGSDGSSAQGISIHNNQCDGFVTACMDVVSLGSTIKNLWTANQLTSGTPIPFNLPNAFTYGMSGTTGNSLTTVAQNSTVFLGVAGQNATEALAYQTMGTAGTIVYLLVDTALAPSAGQNFTYTLDKNGNPTTMTCTISGGAAFTCADFTHPVSVALGDTVDIKLVTSATATATSHVWSLRMDP